MGRKISISQLSAAVMEELEGYADLAAEDMKEAVKKAVQLSGRILKPAHQGIPGTMLKAGL